MSEQQAREAPIHIDDEVDLEWFFNYADGDLGLKSGLGGIQAMLANGGIGSDADAVDAADAAQERLFAACDRYRRIGLCLGRLNIAQQRQLKQAFEERPWARELSVRPKTQRYAAVNSKAVREFLETRAERWSLSLGQQWLARAQVVSEKTSGDVAMSALVALRLAAWGEASRSVGAVMVAYRAAVEDYTMMRSRVRAGRVAKLKGAA